MSNKEMRSAAEIKADIAKWGKRGVSWAKDGQKLALEVLEHIDTHGDITLADKLVCDMPKGTKQTAMAEFLVAFGKLKVSEKQDKKNGRIFAFEKGKTTDLVGAAKKPWFEFQPEPEVVTVFDAQAATLAMIDKIIKASKGKDIKTVHHAEVLEKLAALKDELCPEYAEEPIGQPNSVD